MAASSTAQPGSCAHATSAAQGLSRGSVIHSPTGLMCTYGDSSTGPQPRQRHPQPNWAHVHMQRKHHKATAEAASSTAQLGSCAHTATAAQGKQQAVQHQAGDAGGGLWQASCAGTGSWHSRQGSATRADKVPAAPSVGGRSFRSCSTRCAPCLRARPSAPSGAAWRAPAQRACRGGTATGRARERAPPVRAGASVLYCVACLSHLSEANCTHNSALSGADDLM